MLYVIKMAYYIGFIIRALELPLVECHGKAPRAPLSRQSVSLSCPRQGNYGLKIRFVAKLGTAGAIALSATNRRA